MKLDERIQAYMDENFAEHRLLKETERGSVWLASDKAGHPVIIKHIRRTGLPYRKLKGLSHPLWPGIRFVSESGTDTWVVEEYVSGKNLWDFKEDGHFLTENEVRSILFQMADGLTVLHRAGILHRDIKPSNLIWQGRQIWLVDFDAAREMRDGDEPDTHILGTSGYAPPEQYGFGQTDARSDLYALGKTLDELLDPAVQGGIRNILRRMTAFAPKERYASAEALKNAITFERAKPWLLCGLLLSVVFLGLLFYRSPSETIPTSQEQMSQEATAQKDETKKEGQPTEIHEPTPPTPQEDEAPKKQQRLPQVAIPQTSIQAALLLNGTPLDSKTITVPYEEWKHWKELGRDNYYRRTLVLPEDWTLALHIENDGQAAVQNPRMEMEQSGAAPITVNADIIGQGEQTTLSLPLAGNAVKSQMMESIGVHLRMDNAIDPADAHKYYWNLHIYLEPPPSETKH